MIYLDYSATTMVNEEVLDTYVKVCKDFIGNPNSLHKLGVDAKRLIDASTKQITDILGVNASELIYTSGATEANNTAIKGVCLKYQNRGKHIITTKLEHSSVVAALSYLTTLGFEVSFVELNSDGTVNIDNLKELIRDDTILVTISSINSEVGIRQPIDEIGKILKDYSKIYFHSDITQSVGKEKIDLSNVDLASFSAQKFYGMKGIGGLIKKDGIVIEPLIHGGKSTTIYRGGTPATALIVSTAKALRLAYDNIEVKNKYVYELNCFLRKELGAIRLVHINSLENSTSYILNVSVDGVKPETMLHALEEHGVYISTQTACSKGEKSEAVYAITKVDDYATHSLRISLSSLTTKEELIQFVKVFKEEIEKLGGKYENN